MSDTKVRRVIMWEDHHGLKYEHVADHDLGRHMLVPVEVWGRVVNALKAIEGNCEGYGDSHAVGAYNIANRALAEIGGEDG